MVNKSTGPTSPDTEAHSFSGRYAHVIKQMLSLTGQVSQWLKWAHAICYHEWKLSVNDTHTDQW